MILKREKFGANFATIWRSFLLKIRLFGFLKTKNKLRQKMAKLAK